MVVLLAYLVMVALIGRSQRALPRAATDFDFLYLENFSKKSRPSPNRLKVIPFDWSRRAEQEYV